MCDLGIQLSNRSPPPPPSSQIIVELAQCMHRSNALGSDLQDWGQSLNEAAEGQTLNKTKHKERRQMAHMCPPKTVMSFSTGGGSVWGPGVLHGGVKALSAQHLQVRA